MVAEYPNNIYDTYTSIGIRPIQVLIKTPSSVMDQIKQMMGAPKQYNQYLNFPMPIPSVQNINRGKIPGNKNKIASIWINNCLQT